MHVNRRLDTYHTYQTHIACVGVSELEQQQQSMHTMESAYQILGAHKLELVHGCRRALSFVDVWEGIAGARWDCCPKLH